MLALNAEQLAVAYMIQSGFTASFVDGATSGLIFLVALTAATAIPTWTVAKRKGRSAVCWVSFALAIPVIPLVVIWLLPILRTHD